MSPHALSRWISALLPLLLLAACSLAPESIPPAARAAEPITSPSPPTPAETPAEAACPVTEPSWVTPLEDAAVLDEPQPSYYFVNEDASIWAPAWWALQGEEIIIPREEGYKVGWFRPAGAELEVTGRRLDGEAPPLDFHAPCCYPTCFQASGLDFPTGGCWEVNARAEDSKLSFVVWIEP